MGVLRCAFRGLLITAGVCLFIALIPGLPPHSKFEPISVKPPLPLKGALALNDKLNNAERLFENEVKGPEGFGIYKNELYTTLHNGYIVKLVNGKLVPVVKFGQDCGGVWDEAKCGRPLGIRFRGDFMYACDAYYGVFKVDMKTGKYEQLVSMDVPIEGKLPKMPNSVTVASDGTVYWTESMTENSLEDGLYSLLASGSGRLVKYDPKTKTHEVLIENLHFANGVGIAPDDSYVIAAELSLSRIYRYHLKGPQKGTTDIFIEGLPGLPDNIQEDGAGGFYVTLVIPVDEENAFITQKLGPYPLLRRFLSRLLYLVEAPVKFIDEVFPNYYTQQLKYRLGSFESVSLTSSERITVVKLNKDGDIVESLHSTDGKITMISDFIPFNGYYYLGSPFNPYLARVKIN